jgi:hypothetical protein
MSSAGSFHGGLRRFKETGGDFELTPGMAALRHPRARDHSGRSRKATGALTANKVLKFETGPLTPTVNTLLDFKLRSTLNLHHG